MPSWNSLPVIGLTNVITVISLHTPSLLTFPIWFYQCDPKHFANNGIWNTCLHILCKSLCIAIPSWCKLNQTLSGRYPHSLYCQTLVSLVFRGYNLVEFKACKEGGHWYKTIRFHPLTRLENMSCLLSCKRISCGESWQSSWKSILILVHHVASVIWLLRVYTFYRVMTICL